MDIHWHNPHRIHRITVKDNLLFASDLRYLLNGLDGADLVVAVHDGHQDRIIPDGRGHIIRIHSSLLVNRDRGHPKVHHFKDPEGPENSIVLNV